MPRRVATLLAAQRRRRRWIRLLPPLRELPSTVNDSSTPDGQGSTALRPGPTAARLLVAVFVCVMAATALFSWMVSGRVRQDAKLADEHLRTVAWAVLLHVDSHGGFPTSESELAATPFAPTASADAAGRWPATADLAGVPSESRERWADRLAESLRRLDVRFSTDPSQPPNLTAGGRATGLGTLAELTGWLRARADALVAR